MEFEDLFRDHKSELDDFWGRVKNEQRYQRHFHICGQPVSMTSNQERILESADLVRPLYSIAEPMDAAPFEISLIVNEGERELRPPPDDLFDRVSYAGYGSWATIDLAGWGFCTIDLDDRSALGVIRKPLADNPELFARFVLNTLLTNFLIASGFGMLHATALYRGGSLLLLMAPHNSGKSTAALRLAMAGYQLVSDSMVYCADEPDGPRVFAFPVGRVKLRADVLDRFEELSHLLEREPVRGELKYGLDLRRHDPSLVRDKSLIPSKVTLLLLSRRSKQETVIRVLEPDEMWRAVMANSLFYDRKDVWVQNLRQIESLLGQARCYDLTEGSDPDGFINAITTLES